MDADGTRSHVVLTPAEWRDAIARGTPADAEVDRGGAALRRLPVDLAMPAGDSAPRPEDRRAAALLPGGRVVWADGGVLREGDGEPWWPDPPHLGEPVLALGVSGGRLVAGIAGGLLVFDLRSGHPPRRLRWPVPFAPVSVAPTAGGGIAVLDAGRVWRLDAALQRVVTAETAPRGTFVPATGDAPAGPLVRQLRAGDAVAVPADAVAVLAGGEHVVTARGRLVRIDDGRSWSLGQRVHDAVRLDDGRLLAVDAQGNQVHSYRLDEDGRPEREARLLPLRRFDGARLASDGRDVLYRGAGGWSPLAAQSRPRHARSAALVTAVLDGRETSCAWHRVVLDGDVPPGTRVLVDAVAADDAAALEGPRLPWRPQPVPIARRGAELPWTTPLGTAYELLLQELRGRFARVRVRLEGDGRSTPVVRSLRVWCPRPSLRDRHLPVVFAEEDPGGLLDRFLANPGGLLGELEDRIATAQALLSTWSAPPEALDWLAAWFDLVLDPAFDDRRRRLFLRHAHRLLALRGTPWGLQLALRLALDPEADDEALLDPHDPATRALRVVEAHGPRGATGRWRPEEGAGALHDRWREATGQDAFPPRPAVVTPAWLRFCDTALGWRPGTTDADDARWRAFLERRHGTPARAAAVHEDVARWPGALPESPAALRDWHDAGAVVLSAARHAHRFTVLLPVSGDEDGDDPPVRARVALAERVLAAQRPAHTVSAVRLYLAAFRLGEARLGEGTAVARRHRPRRDAVLGTDHLGEAVLGGPASPMPTPTEDR